MRDGSTGGSNTSVTSDTVSAALTSALNQAMKDAEDLAACANTVLQGMNESMNECILAYHRHGFEIHICTHDIHINALFVAEANWGQMYEQGLVKEAVMPPWIKHHVASASSVIRFVRICFEIA